MNFIRQNKLSLLWAGCILLLTGLPGNYFPRVVSFWEWISPDKLVHLFMFMVLAFVMMFDRRKQYTGKNKRYVVILVLGFGVFYGALTEILQYYVFVRRHGSIYDFYANTLGIVAGIGLFILLRRKIIKLN